MSPSCKRTKIVITHTCGHTTTHYLKGDPTQVAAEAKKLEMRPCYKCYQNQEYEYATKFARDHQYPKLSGGSITTEREAILARFHILVDFGKRFDKLVLESSYEKRKEMIRRSIWINLLNHEDTAFWIKWDKEHERLWEICGGKKAITVLKEESGFKEENS